MTIRDAVGVATLVAAVLPSYGCSSSDASVGRDPQEPSEGVSRQANASGLKQASVAAILDAPVRVPRDPLSEAALNAVRDGAPDELQATTEKSWVPVAEDVWCWDGSRDWLCYGDEGCFFLFAYVCAPGDYAYCDGYWPDYLCVCRSAYYACQ